MFGISLDVAIKIMCNLYNIAIIHKWQNSEAYDVLENIRPKFNWGVKTVEGNKP